MRSSSMLAWEVVETDELNPAYNDVVEEKVMINSKYIWLIKEK